jgi:hypothetical protein
MSTWELWKSQKMSSQKNNDHPISCYDPRRFDSVSHGGYTLEQAKAGGRKRAATGKKHPVYKFYLPENVDTVSLSPDYKHGVAGGQARIKAATRDNKGRFTK